MVTEGGHRPARNGAIRDAGGIRGCRFSRGVATLDAYLTSARRAAPGAGAASGAAVSAGRVKYDSLAVALVAFAICVAGVAAGLWAMLVR